MSIPSIPDTDQPIDWKVITPKPIAHLIAKIRAEFKSEASRIKPGVSQEWTAVDDWAHSFAQLACDTFRRVLRIALAKAGAHRFEPVEWAQSHVQVLIKEELGRVGPELLPPERARRVEMLLTKQLHNAVESARTQTEMRNWRKSQPAAPLELPVEFKRLVQVIENLSGSATVIPDVDRKGSPVEMPFAAPGPAAAQQQPAVPGPDKDKAAATATTSQSSDAEVATWDTIEILFLSDERVQIWNGTNTETRNFAEFGFADGRNGKPTQAWVTLRALAEERGTIRDATKTGRAWPKVEKRMQEIRRALRKHFGISADPVPYVDGTGYRACFKIGCGPSFHT